MSTYNYSFTNLAVTATLSGTFTTTLATAIATFINNGFSILEANTGAITPPVGVNITNIYSGSGNYFPASNAVIINLGAGGGDAVALNAFYSACGGDGTIASTSYYLLYTNSGGDYIMTAYKADGSTAGTLDGTINTSASITLASPAVCFAENSKILCQSDTGKEQYTPIQDIRKGTLVKTMKNIYIPVEMIGKRQIINNNTLYKLSPNKYSELTEDLILTGNHSILVDQISEEQREKTKQITGDVFYTDGKIRLLAQLDDRADEYFDNEAHNIYHLALENDNPFKNYGIYANGGLLVETASIRTMEEMSGMDLL